MKICTKHPQASPSPITQHGFTLIELLTVIAIIGILAGILIPTVGKVRNSARNTQCLSNLRQLAMILTEDIAEHKDTVPHAWRDPDPDSGFAGGGWIDMTWNELVDKKDVSRLGVFVCPAQLSKINKTYLQTFTYSMNLAPTRNSWFNPDHPNRRRLSSFAAPSRTVILADGYLQGTGYNCGFAYDKPPELIHGDRANFAYLDGHIASLTRASIPAYGEASVASGTPARLFWMGAY